MCRSEYLTRKKELEGKIDRKRLGEHAINSLFSEILSRCVSSEL